jgi:transaldolase/glucose-6-phosphate isomerase
MHLDNLNLVRQEVHRLQLELEPIRRHYGEILADLEEKDVSRRIWQADIALWTDERRAARKLSGHRGWLDLVSHVNLIMEDCRSFSRDMEDLGVTELKVICPGSVGDFIGALIQKFGHPERELSRVDPGAMEAPEVAKTDKLDGTHYMFVIDGTNNQQMYENIEALVKTLAENGLSDAADRISLIAASEAQETIQQSTKGIQQTFSLPEDLPFHFSVLSYPGIMAASWLGIDPELIRNGFASIMNRCLPTVPVEQHPGLAMAGAIEAAMCTRFERLELCTDTAWFPFITWIESFLIECGLFQQTGLEFVRTEEPGKFEPLDAESLLIFLHDPACISGPIKERLSKRNPVKMIDLQAGAHSLGELAGLLFFTTAVLGHFEAVYPFNRRV